MSANFISIDGFLEDPIKERETALKSEYKTIKHNELSYRGISIVQDEKSLDKIGEILGVKIAKDQSEAMYRRYFSSEVNETYIHSDVLIAHYTGILFLSDPKNCSGGTAFWKHKKLGIDKHPSPEELVALGIPDTKETWDSVYQDGFDESKWTMTGAAQMKFNRLVLFEGPKYHSRYPMKTFGTTLDDSRLIKVFFCKVA